MDELLSQDEINALLTGETLSPPAMSLSMEDTQVLDEVATIFSNAESNVFGMLAGKDVSVRIEETSALGQVEFKNSVSERSFVFRATFGGFDDIPLILVADRQGALALADLMMGGEGKDLPEEVSELYLNAAQEGLSQVVGSAFTSLSGILGGRRLMPENAEAALSEEDWQPFSHLGDDGQIWCSAVKVDIEELETFSIRIGIPLESAKSIADVIHQVMGAQAPAPSPASPRPAAPASARPEPPAAAGRSAPPPSLAGGQTAAPLVDVRPAEFTPLLSKGGAPGGSKIDLIADIPVRVTVELGKTRKNISEILAMAQGSVIELDKMAGEPVDVLVNGKLIARGEVVVIDENFGVRITEVLNTPSRAYAL